MKAKIYLDIENALNMIDDDWGAKSYINTQDVPSGVGVVDATIDPGGNSYTYTNFTNPKSLQTPDTWDSLYRVQLGIRADF